jgi:hypothetical protein
VSESPATAVEPTEEPTPVPEAKIPPDDAAEVVEYAQVLNVVLPVNLNFTIDPLELNGRGSLYSDPKRIVNESDWEVLFEITNVNIAYATGSAVAPVKMPFESNADDREKLLYMQLDIAGRSYVLTDSSVAIEPIPLASSDGENSTCDISLSGCVNPNADKAWQAGDVTIGIEYKLTPVTEEAGEEASPSDTDPIDDSESVSPAASQAEAKEEDAEALP